MGSEAAQMLIARLRGEAIASPRHHRLPTQLVVRESSDPTVRTRSSAARSPRRMQMSWTMQSRALNNAWLINQTVEVVVSSSPHFEQCYEGGGVSPSAGQAAAGWRGGRTSLTVSAGLPGRNCAWRSSPGWNAPITANVVNAPSAGSPRSSLRQFNRLPPRP